MPEPKNWKRLALEGVVILISILLAFGIEAWWQEQQEQREVEQSLDALRDELDEQLGQLWDVRDANQKRVDGIPRLLALSAAELDGLTPASVDSLFVHVDAYASFLPSTAALDAILFANVLEHIADVGLRHAIAAYAAWIRSPDVQLAWVEETVRTTDARLIELGGLDVRAVCYDAGEPPCMTAEYFARIMTDDRLRNLLANKAFMIRSYNNDLADLEGHIDQLLSQLLE